MDTMQSYTSSTNSNNILVYESYEKEIEMYSGDDPLSVWCRYIEWICNVNEAAYNLLRVRFIKQFSENKKYHNDWRFVEICLSMVQSCEDKIGACRELYDCGIGKQEGLFYKLWANAYAEVGQNEVANAIYTIGQKLSTNHDTELKYSYELFLERCSSEERSFYKDVKHCYNNVLEENNIKPNEPTQVFMAPMKKLYRNSQEFCLEELMALERQNGKCRSRKLATELKKKTNLWESRRRSVFGLLGNISEETENYQTNKSTISPAKILDEKTPCDEVSRVISPCDDEVSRVISRKPNVSINSHATMSPRNHTRTINEPDNILSDEENEDDDLTKHGRYAKEYLENLFFGTSQIQKSFLDVSVEDKKSEEPFKIYEDPFEIYEDPSDETQRKVEEKSVHEILYVEMPVDICKKKPATPRVTQFEDNSFFNISQADKSISSFQDFFDGLNSCKTSTQNVTGVVKSLGKLTKTNQFLTTINEYANQSREICRQEPDEMVHPDISLCDVQACKDFESTLQSTLTHPYVDAEFKNSILCDVKKHHVEHFLQEETFAKKMSSFELDDILFQEGISILNMDKSQMQVDNGGERMEGVESNACDYVACYETPLKDHDDSYNAQLKVSKENSRWRRCSAYNIVPHSTVPTILDGVIRGEDYDLSFKIEDRFYCGNNKNQEMMPANLTTSFTNMSILIDRENPYNEDSIKSFISHLKPPLSKYPGYHETFNVKMPAFKLNSCITFGTNKFIVKRILGEGAHAKAYQLSYLGHGLEDIDCVAKFQRPSCPWEFYITRELHKRLKELIQDTQFIDVRSSVMYITEAHFYQDGSLFLNEMHNHGTLLDLINLQKSKLIELPQWFVLALSYELVCIVDAMHRCSMIHGDLKPDNILLRQLPLLKSGENIYDFLQTGTAFMKLIDFGQSIDMAMYPPGTEFMARPKKKDFHCTEMKMQKPWSYHMDLYFLAGVMYVLIMGDYMKPTLVGNKWCAHIKLKRSWKHEERIREFIDMLINIESSDNMPDLSLLGEWLLSAVEVERNAYNAFIKHCSAKHFAFLHLICTCHPQSSVSRTRSS